MFVKDINTKAQVCYETLHGSMMLKIYKMESDNLYILTKYIFY